MIQAFDPKTHLEQERRDHSHTIDQRDHAEDMANQLAQKISVMTGTEIGEHSSGNCPWLNAIDAADWFDCVPRAVADKLAEALQITSLAHAIAVKMGHIPFDDGSVDEAATAALAEYEANK